MKLIDEELGGTTPLRGNFKISKKKEEKIQMRKMSLKIGVMKI